MFRKSFQKAPPRLLPRGFLYVLAAAAAAKSLQSCPTLCDPIDGSPWDSLGKNTGVGCHFLLQCMKVKSESEVAQSCPTLSDPMDCSPPGSSVHGIFQARVLEWGAIAFSTLCSYHGGNSHHVFCKGCQHFPLLLPLFLASLCPRSPPITPSDHVPLLPPQDGNQKEAGAQHLRPAPDRLREFVGLRPVSPASQPPPPPAAASWHQTHCSSLSHPTGTLSQ